MGSRPSSLLTELTWQEVRERLHDDSRLLVPVGDCDQHGPHLPIGATTVITDRLVTRLSDEMGVLRAPVIPFGVTARTEASYPGAAGLTEKTLHRVLNELVAQWEGAGFTEFLLVTAHGDDSQVEALASVMVHRARIRVIDILTMELSQFLSDGARVQHAGELETSLLLHLAPEMVRSHEISDFRLPTETKGPFGTHRMPTLPTASLGVLGRPTTATAERGEKIFDYICETIRDRVLLAAPA